MEKAPLPSEPQPETGATSQIMQCAASQNVESDNTVCPSSVMKLCLGGKSKEVVEGPGWRVDRKLEEMDTHMNNLRYRNITILFYSYCATYIFVTMT